VRVSGRVGGVPRRGDGAASPESDGGAAVTDRFLIADGEGCVHAGGGMWTTVRDDAETYGSEASAAIVLRVVGGVEPFRNVHIEPEGLVCVTHGCGLLTTLGRILCDRCVAAIGGGP
jgi:hypothetical protein